MSGARPCLAALDGPPGAQLGGASRAKLEGAVAKAWFDGTSQWGWVGSAQSWCMPGLDGEHKLCVGVTQREPWPWPPFLASFLPSVRGWVASVFRFRLGAPRLLPQRLQASWAAQPDPCILLCVQQAPRLHLGLGGAGVRGLPEV